MRPEGLRGHRFSYRPGAGSNWHVHTGEQALVVVHGRGLVQWDGLGEPQVLEPGDWVHVQPGDLPLARGDLRQRVRPPGDHCHRSHRVGRAGHQTRPGADATLGPHVPGALGAFADDLGGMSRVRTPMPSSVDPSPRPPRAISDLSPAVVRGGSWTRRDGPRPARSLLKGVCRERLAYSTRTIASRMLLGSVAPPFPSRRSSWGCVCVPENW